MASPTEQATTMDPDHRIAFIKTGGFSHINGNVLALLRNRFPDASIDVVDTNDLPVWRKWQLPVLAVNALLHYGPRSCRSIPLVRRFGRHTPWVFDAARSQLAARLNRVKYRFTFQTQSTVDASQPGTPHFVYTDHTYLTNLHYPGFDQANLYARAWIRREQSIFENARVVFTMSSHVSRSLENDYGIDGSKIHCARIGSNVAIPPASSLPDERYRAKRILFVGVHWERKGGPQLVAAFKQVLRQHPDAHLTIIGCSPTVDVPNCTVLGKLPLDEIGKHYRNATVFCMPTRNEPFGVVFLEAFAHRLPIVSTDLGALPDLIQNSVSGYRVPPDDINELAARIVELISSPQRCKEFGEAGFQHMQARYTWEGTGVEISERIKQELSGHARTLDRV